ncbi:flagellar biosynthesis protein FlhB [Rhizobacter sp. Root1221]|uniref:EscU/YscU/HrcU family type III secretion system export apparatus switch protein n=1 Tax=Rhizobacter sp. Root1221 TaxID=1736433 RepID=UPI0006F8D125|nr:EscU/YscU/HrcU family type III secretion system export apparatus switch protein [Rhizobacter sp. Root1221]KQW02537.1 type III secretion protein [Rhizobacter sp. Root1221]
MAEKTHDPTPKRLRDARKRGEVVFSADVASTAVFVGVVLALWLLGATGFSALRELWLHATNGALLRSPGASLPGLLQHAQAVWLWGVLPVAGVAAFAGIVGSFVQVGALAAWQRLSPDVNRLNPAEGLKRMFSTRSLINLVKVVVKTLLLGALLFVVVRGFIETALKLGYVDPASALNVAARMVLVTFAWAAVIYAVMAVVDFVHQRYEFIKQQRMSIEDLQREYKENEGDPLTSARRKSAHFEQVYASLADRVRAASAVIHSPRVAVALQYLGEKDLPRVIARGENEVAAQIRRAAGEALVPLAFEPSLAERLYAEVPEDMAIPRSLYEPVARLLRWAQGDEPTPPAPPPEPEGDAS